MNSTDIHKAARDGNMWAVQAFLKQGGDVCELDSFDCEPLYYAVKHDQFEVAQVLLSNGGHINRSSKFRGDPIGAAVWNVNPRMIRLAVSSGANVNRIKNGESPLDYVDSLRRMAKNDLQRITDLNKIEELLLSLGGQRARNQT